MVYVGKYHTYNDIQTQSDKQTSKQIDRGSEKQKQTLTQTHSDMYSHTDIYTDIHADRSIERQTERRKQVVWLTVTIGMRLCSYFDNLLFGREAVILIVIITIGRRTSSWSTQLVICHLSSMSNCLNTGAKRNKHPWDVKQKYTNTEFLLCEFL